METQITRAERSVTLKWRILVTATAALIGFLSVVVGTGLLIGDVRGAADNGDGGRLYCGAGLIPATPDSRANWVGGVVLQFGSAPRCADPIPSSALPVLRAAAVDGESSFSLTRLGWLYAALIGGISGVAAFACSRRSIRRTLILLPVIAPIFLTNFSRFFISTYSEPAALLGLVSMFCGGSVILVTSRKERPERVIGLALVACGALVAATAKLQYLPILGIGVLLCAATPVSFRWPARKRTDRIVGPILAVLLVVASIAPIRAALSWQERRVLFVNTHNLIFTLVLVEVPGSAPSIGLPPSASEFAGQAFYPRGGDGIPGASFIAVDPEEYRARALAILARHPRAALRSIGIALQATMASSLRYLPAEPWTITTVGPNTDEKAGEEGADPSRLQAWLDRMPVPWFPAAITVLGLALGVVGLLRRRQAWTIFAALAGLAAISSLLLAVVAVLGDGYFEISKHVWLSAYCLAVAIPAMLASFGLMAREVIRRLAPPRTRPTV